MRFAISTIFAFTIGSACGQPNATEPQAESASTSSSADLSSCSCSSYTAGKDIYVSSKHVISLDKDISVSSINSENGLKTTIARADGAENLLLTSSTNAWGGTFSDSSCSGDTRGTMKIFQTNGGAAAIDALCFCGMLYPPGAPAPYYYWNCFAAP